MKKIITTTACFLFMLVTHAQKGIENLIRAEKDFAAYSVAHSTKEAFQKFIDSSSIMFDNGKPVKAIEFWEKKEKHPGVLSWWPQYVEISASDDFGYTTGPWTFQNSIKDSVIARGQYITVWHINKNGEWKFLVDLGISNTQVNAAANVIRINTAKQEEIFDTIPFILPVVAAENEFLGLFTKNKTKAYKKYLSEESILNRNGNLPAVSIADRKKMIRSTPSFDKYQIQAGEVSTLPAHDMGYTYGSTIYNGKTENYLRIWRRERSGWKIAVEVLRY